MCDVGITDIVEDIRTMAKSATTKANAATKNQGDAYPNPLPDEFKMKELMNANINCLNCKYKRMVMNLPTDCILKEKHCKVLLTF